MAVPIDTSRYGPEIDLGEDLMAPSQAANGIVRGEVLDAITEELVQAPGPAGRAVIILELVQEICATVEWLQATLPGLGPAEAAELIAVSRLARTARDHRGQLTTPTSRCHVQTPTGAPMSDAFGPELPATAAELWGLSGTGAPQDLPLDRALPPAADGREPDSEPDVAPSPPPDVAQ